MPIELISNIRYVLFCFFKINITNIIDYIKGCQRLIYHGIKLHSCFLSLLSSYLFLIRIASQCWQRIVHIGFHFSF